MTRNQVLNLKVGDKVRHTMDACNGKALPGARYGEPKRVVNIHAQEVSEYHGRAYVCFYTEFGPTSTISGSCQEDQETYILAE
jgi:hypothetical protein